MPLLLSISRQLRRQTLGSNSTPFPRHGKDGSVLREEEAGGEEVGVGIEPEHEQERIWEEEARLKAAQREKKHDDSPSLSKVKRLASTFSSPLPPPRSRTSSASSISSLSSLRDTHSALSGFAGSPGLVAERGSKWGGQVQRRRRGSGASVAGSIAESEEESGLDEAIALASGNEGRGSLDLVSPPPAYSSPDPSESSPPRGRAEAAHQVAAGDIGLGIPNLAELEPGLPGCAEGTYRGLGLGASPRSYETEDEDATQWRRATVRPPAIVRKISEIFADSGAGREAEGETTPKKKSSTGPGSVAEKEKERQREREREREVEREREKEKASEREVMIGKLGGQLKEAERRILELEEKLAAMAAEAAVKDIQPRPQPSATMAIPSLNLGPSMEDIVNVIKQTVQRSQQDLPAIVKDIPVYVILVGIGSAAVLSRVLFRNGARF